MKHLVPTTLVLAGCLCLSGMMAEAAQARFFQRAGGGGRGVEGGG